MFPSRQPVPREAPGGSERGLKARSLPTGAVEPGVFTEPGDLGGAQALLGAEKEEVAAQRQTGPGTGGGRSFRGSVLYLGRCRRASRRREQGHRGLQGEGKPWLWGLWGH